MISRSQIQRASIKAIKGSKPIIEQLKIDDSIGYKALRNLNIKFEPNLLKGKAVKQLKGGDNENQADGTRRK